MEAAHNQDHPGLIHPVGPVVQQPWRADHMAHDVDDAGGFWMALQRHQSLHAQQVRAQRHLQRPQRLLQFPGVNRVRGREAECGGCIAVGVHVVMMVMVMVVLTMPTVFKAQPLCHVRGFTCRIESGERDPQVIRDSNALGMLVEPEDIASVVHFLCSDAARAVSGQMIPIDAAHMAKTQYVGFAGGVPWDTEGQP